MPADFAIICNPTSRNGRVGRLLPQVRKAFEGHGASVSVYPTERARHAPELVAQALSDGHTKIVAMGGDGTFHEVANGLRQADGSFADVALGLLPCGTGNDFPRTFSFPKSIAELVAILVAGKTKQVDAGLMVHGDRETVFVSVAGAGVCARINELAGTRFTGLGGLRYAAAGVSGLIERTHELRAIRLDDMTLEGPYAFVAVANTGFFGNGMPVAPFAEASDGQFDVILCESGSRLEITLAFPRIFNASHLEHPKVSSRRAAEVEVPQPADEVLVADGETYRSTPATYRILPGVLRLIVP